MEHLTRDVIARCVLDERNPPPYAGYRWKPLTPEEKRYADAHTKSCETCREGVTACKGALGFQIYVAALLFDPE